MKLARIQLARDECGSFFVSEEKRKKRTVVRKEEKEIKERDGPEVRKRRQSTLSL